jgi:hypothetical protein
LWSWLISSSKEKTLGVGRVFVLFSGALIVLAVLELVFRLAVFPDWRIVSQVRFETHPIYNTFQKPNLDVRRYKPPNYDIINRTNSQGFRDRETGFKTDLNSLWVSGMSNSYGGFIENSETFSRVLQDKYGYRNALLASEGHVLPNQVAVMRHLHHQGYRPSLVVLELTLNNVLRGYADGTIALGKPFFVPKTASTAASERALVGVLRRVETLWTRLLSIDFIGVKLRLINNSALYAWAKVGVNANPGLRDFTLKAGLRADPALSDNVPLDMLTVKPNIMRDRLVGELADYVALIGRWVRTTLKADFAVVLLPSKHYMNPDWFVRYLAFRGHDGAGLDAGRPFWLLKEALEHRDVPVLDMAGPIAGAKKFMNFPDDGHINAVGHALIAQELAAWLKVRFKREPDIAP